MKLKYICCQQNSETYLLCGDYGLICFGLVYEEEPSKKKVPLINLVCVCVLGYTEIRVVVS